jgi:DNA-binding NarL/FixJ family response regulator
MRARKKITIKLLNAEHEANTQALKAELLTEEAHKRDWLNDLYGYVSDRLASLQEQFNTLSQRYVTSQPKVYQAMVKILHETDTDLHDIPKSLIPDDETFYSYTNIIDDENVLTINEKMILMLLACNASNKQIATFMNTSPESIRVRKSQLKKKMLEKGMDISAFV